MAIMHSLLSWTRVKDSMLLNQRVKNLLVHELVSRTCSDSFGL